MRAIFIFYLFIVSGKAQSFPDTIRHGYTNCTSCHVSPSGGGLLNGYGRSLSRELLSTWSYKNEEQPLHGLVKVPESLVEKVYFGGDIRHLSRRVESQNTHVRESFLMQVQWRLGFAIDQIKFLMSVGKINNPKNSQEIKIVSSEYFVLWNPKEELYLRAGRFEPIYGLRMADHNLWTRSEVGFAPWLERDTVEFIYEGESQFASLAGFQSTSSTNTAQQTTGYTASLYQILFATSRIGLSAMNSEGQGVRSKSASLHGVLAFSDKAYSLFEYSRVWLTDSAKDVAFLRFGYEMAKGFTPILQSQAKLDRTSSNANQYKHGFGIIWMPRPHLELTGMIEQIKKNKESLQEGTILVHYYF